MTHWKYLWGKIGLENSRPREQDYDFWQRSQDQEKLSQTELEWSWRPRPFSRDHKTGEMWINLH